MTFFFKLNNNLGLIYFNISTLVVINANLRRFINILKSYQYCYFSLLALVVTKLNFPQISTSKHNFQTNTHDIVKIETNLFSFNHSRLKLKMHT